MPYTCSALLDFNRKGGSKVSTKAIASISHFPVFFCPVLVKVFNGAADLEEAALVDGGAAADLQRHLLETIVDVSLFLDRHWLLRAGRSP